MSFAIIAIIIFLFLLFLFFVALIVIGLTADRKKSEIRRFSVFSSLTSKVSVANIKTLIGIILVVAVIIIAIISVIEAAFFAVALLSEDFSDNTTSQDYWYDGNFSIADESLKMRGKTVVFNNETSNDFFGTYYNEHPDFKIIGRGKGTIKVIMDNGNQTPYEEEVSVDGSFEIKFGTCSEIEREVNAIYFKLNGVSSTLDKDPVLFYTDRQYSAKVYFNGNFVVTKINLGA